MVAYRTARATRYTFGPACGSGTIDVPAGVRLQPIAGEPGAFWVDDPAWPPVGSLQRHDATFYGIRVMAADVLATDAAAPALVHPDAAANARTVAQLKARGYIERRDAFGGVVLTLALSDGGRVDVSGPGGSDLPTAAAWCAWRYPDAAPDSDSNFLDARDGGTLQPDAQPLSAALDALESVEGAPRAAAAVLGQETPLDVSGELAETLEAVTRALLDVSGGPDAVGAPYHAAVALLARIGVDIEGTI